MKRSTILGDLRGGVPFTWGQLIDIHDIGAYTIVCYHPWTTEKNAVKVGTPSLGELSYHGYVNGKNTSESWPSLDAALAGCIAYKREGANHRADWYFMKMIQD